MNTSSIKLNGYTLLKDEIASPKKEYQPPVLIMLEVNTPVLGGWPELAPENTNGALLS